MIGTEFRLFDLSDIPSLPDTSELDTSPILMVAAASDKGPERPTLTGGKKFLELFGTGDFEKYGQISEQTVRSVANGARVFFKRLVAPDSTIANAVVCAELYQTSAQAQKKNAKGELLYIKQDGTETIDTEEPDLVNDPTGATMIPTTPALLYLKADGTETTASEEPDLVTDPTGQTLMPTTPMMEYVCNTNYTFNSVPSVGGDDFFETVKEQAKLLLDETGTQRTLADGTTVDVFTYPLFVITDNGRGISNKRWYINPERNLSKNLGFMFYALNIVEDGEVTDSVTFSIIPNTRYRGANVTLDIKARSGLSQVKATSFDDINTKYIEKVQELSMIDYDVLVANDILFGCQRKGTPIKGLAVDSVNGLQLNLQTGFQLANGSNGSFGDIPYKTEEGRANVEEEMLRYYKGELTDLIWDKDQYQIDLCFDADFPVAVKEAIAYVAAYREDFMFFRDYGLEMYTYDDIYRLHEELTPSMYIADFAQAYDVVSPYTTKINTVTITYSISAIMIAHMVNNRHCPFAGKRYNAVINDIIPDTLRYTPRVIPGLNEKDELEELKVNFASYFNDKFVIESVWTSQTRYTQLSFSNNVIALQQVLKALRTKFPAIRYAFITKKEDLAVYEKEVNDVLSLYAANFAELSYEYIDDAVYRANKIFRAKIKFRFNDFVQAELIDVYALPTEEFV